MLHKDLAIIMETGRAYGMPLPATAVNLALFEAMLQMGMRDQDNSGVIGVLEAMAGTGLLSAEA